MKRIFILLLVSNFYNIHASQYLKIYNSNTHPNLTEDQKLLPVLTTIVQETFTKQNFREISFNCVQDQQGKFLSISISENFDQTYFTFYEQSPTLSAVIAQLPLYHTQDQELTKLKDIISLRLKDRVIIRSNASPINW